MDAGRWRPSPGRGDDERMVAAGGEVPGGLEGAVGHAVHIGREGFGDDDDTHTGVVAVLGVAVSTWIFPPGERPMSVCAARPRRAASGAPWTDGAPAQTAGASGPILLRTAVWTSASSAGSAASRRSRSTTRASPVSACRAATSRVVSSQSQRHSTAKPAGEGGVGGGQRAGGPAAQVGGGGLPVDVAQDGGGAGDAQAARAVDEGPQARGVGALAPDGLAQRGEDERGVLRARPGRRALRPAAAPRASGRWAQRRARSTAASPHIRSKAATAASATAR